jgi:predicted GNAT superfamily acetyltransferase
MSGPIVIRPIATLEEYEECLRLQHLTWGPGFEEGVPSSVFAFLRRIGGLVLGAFAEEPPASGRLVGCAISFPGLVDGAWVQWSDMVAVHPDLRDCGLGFRLKQAQREAALENGFHRLLWTFDPLESRNARLNFGKLDATSRRYEVDFYGKIGCELLRALPTDRLIVEWDLDRAPGAALPTPAVPLQPAACVLERNPESSSGAWGAWPQAPRLDLTASEVWLEVPADLQRLKSHDLPGALAWRQASREAFCHYVAGGGYRVEGFERSGTEPPRSFYRLRR